MISRYELSASVLNYNSRLINRIAEHETRFEESLRNIPKKIRESALNNSSGRPKYDLSLSLEEKLKIETDSENTRKARIADATGSILYAYPVGALLDYVTGITSLWGILTSRATATVINGPAGTYFGAKKEKYEKKLKVDEIEEPVSDFISLAADCSERVMNDRPNNIFLQSLYLYASEKASTDYLRVKKQFASLSSFARTQIPIYMGMAALGDMGDVMSGAQESFDPDVIWRAARNLLYATPVIAPSLSWSMNKVRKYMGVKEN